MSYLVQMAALTVQNFASAAAGIAIAIAVVRGFSRQQMNSLGNFWVDLTRATLYILLPACFVIAIFFCSQGVIQNFHPNTLATTLEGGKQVITQGPVASQEAIKMLGTNGGGFFNANSSHPFENPTPLVNFVQMLLIFVIPAGLTYTFGVMVGDRRQGWSIFSACAFLFLAGALVLYWAEQKGNPGYAKFGVETAATAHQTGGNMEGKETRFGIAASALFATVTTDASCGAVNNAHDSLTPLGGLVPMFNIQTGEVIFGGVGAGLYGILLYAILTVFIAGLMVGRTPEYVGKKIEQKEVKMAMLALIATAFSILVLAGISTVAKFPEPTKDAKGQAVTQSYWNPPGPAIANFNNTGPHGFSEELYAYSSAVGNNGSAFAGLNANTPWYNLTLGIAMLAGRFLFLIPLLAAAGNLARKKKIPATSGTLPTHGPLFVSLLVGTIILVGALTFFPALALGPIVEHFLMMDGKLFSMLLVPIWS
jgi:K+-transporting ATPase ATPase A chain